MPTRTVYIVDTNVVVAGLLAADPVSPVARVLDGMLTVSFAYAISEALLGEYRTVLLRPVLRRLHSLSGSEVEDLLVDLAQHAIVVQPSDPTQPKQGLPVAPDPGDQFLWDLLAFRSDLVLITGDKRLLADQGMRGRAVSPRTFVDGR